MVRFGWPSLARGPVSGRAALGPTLVENFFRKGVKKLNSKKGCRFEKFSKVGTSRPINGREAWGRITPAHPTGGRCQIFFQVPPESLFANKKKFLTREEAPPAAAKASRPLGGAGPLQCGGASRPLGGRQVPLPLYKSPPAP
jgi:hypothetical protein